MSDYHIPVMLQESIEAIVLKEDAVIVDLTFGGGGHSNVILMELGAKGTLYAFDQDVDAEKQIAEDRRLKFCLSNFRHFGRWLEYHGETKVDAIFADLGISSWQIDTAERGFSFRMEEGLLDMRMNQDSKLTASDIVLNYTESQLVNILSRYGEVRNSKSLARSIVAIRKQWGQEVPVTAFNQLLDKLAMGDRRRYFSQVYQALRIEVNAEIEALGEMLMQVGDWLEPGGRFAVLTYHSLEDKLVKNYMKSGNLKGEVERDDYGKSKSPFRIVGSKYLAPSEEEMKINSRSRSAKLRVVEKI